MYWKHLIFTCLALHCMLVVQIVIYNNKCSFSSDKNCALRAIWGQILDLLWIENTAAAFLSLCQDRRSELYKSMVWLSWASLISRLARQMHSKDDTWVWEMLQGQIWNKMFDLNKIIYFLTFFQLCLLIFSTVFSNMLFINSTNLSTLTLKISAFLIERH